MQRTPPGVTLDVVAVRAEVSICVSSGHLIPRRSSVGHLPQASASMKDGGDRTVTFDDRPGSVALKVELSGSWELLPNYTGEVVDNIGTSA